jgi:peroxiredoxin
MDQRLPCSRALGNYAPPMLSPGDTVPAARVWDAPGEEPRQLRDVLGDGLVLLCFYPFDWSPTCTNELLLLRDRREDLQAAGIRAVGMSQDSPWSHRSWREALGINDAVQLLSDWEGEATCACGVEAEIDSMRVAARSAFLLDAGTVRAAWMLGTKLPDIDAVIAAASSLSP